MGWGVDTLILGCFRGIIFWGGRTRAKALLLGGVVQGAGAPPAHPVKRARALTQGRCVCNVSQSRTGNARANAGVLHFVQDDGEKRALASLAGSRFLASLGMTARKAKATAKVKANANANAKAKAKANIKATATATATAKAKARAKATATATAKANTGVLHFVQDDGEKRARARSRARARATLRARATVRARANANARAGAMATAKVRAKVGYQP